MTSLVSVELFTMDGISPFERKRKHSVLEENLDFEDDSFEDLVEHLWKRCRFVQREKKEERKVTDRIHVQHFLELEKLMRERIQNGTPELIDIFYAIVHKDSFPSACLPTRICDPFNFLCLVSPKQRHQLLFQISKLQREDDPTFTDYWHRLKILCQATDQISQTNWTGMWNSLRRDQAERFLEGYLQKAQSLFPPPLDDTSELFLDGITHLEWREGPLPHFVHRDEYWLIKGRAKEPLCECFQLWGSSSLLSGEPSTPSIFAWKIRIHLPESRALHSPSFQIEKSETHRIIRFRLGNPYTDVAFVIGWTCWDLSRGGLCFSFTDGKLVLSWGLERFPA